MPVTATEIYIKQQEAAGRINAAIIKLKVESAAACEEIMKKRLLMQPVLEGGPTCP